VDWSSVAKQACIGMGTKFLDDAKKLMEFVRVWSGGQDGHILKDLEAYERTLKEKRKLYPPRLAVDQQGGLRRRRPVYPSNG
jgi:hypothetical protein